jgi:16S rRNA C967 or C1407 C5-methylase (RsmB/RsmF family)/NOL1/NOP2/fmu family ribosome biogenesis protein
MHREFEQHFRKLFAEDYERFIKAINETPKVSIRLNPNKLEQCHFQDSESIPWAKDAYFLPERPKFYADPLHHAGAYYVQESSSMFFSNFIDGEKPMLALDLCASPGGKSTLILNKLNAESLLVSNELDIKRNKVLVENLNRWGNTNVVVSNAASHQLLPLKNQFDLVVVDAPCSGEGMFRKDKVALEQWSPNFVKSCANVQSNIVSDAYELVKSGGLLIYSTCTFEPEENELQIKQLVEQFDLEPVATPIDESWGVFEKQIETSKGVFPCYYFYLHLAKGEGQFVCAMRKTSIETSTSAVRVKKPIQKLSRANKSVIDEFISLEDSYALTEINGVVHAYPEKYHDFIEQLRSLVPLWKLGTRVGEVSKKNFKPNHELAMSQLVQGFNNDFSIEFEEAIDYLKRMPLKVKPEYEKGLGLAKYKGVAMGWAKNVGNRINNSFPKELILRKEVG